MYFDQTLYVTISKVKAKRNFLKTTEIIVILLFFSIIEPIRAKKIGIYFPKNADSENIGQKVRYGAVLAGRIFQNILIKFAKMFMIQTDVNNTVFKKEER